VPITEYNAAIEHAWYTPEGATHDETLDNVY